MIGGAAFALDEAWPSRMLLTLPDPLLSSASSALPITECTLLPAIWDQAAGVRAGLSHIAVAGRRVVPGQRPCRVHRGKRPRSRNPEAAQGTFPVGNDVGEES